MSAFASALVGVLEILYGSFFLGAALIYSCLQREFWHPRTKQEDLALQEGELVAWTIPTALISVLTYKSFS